MLCAVYFFVIFLKLKTTGLANWSQLIAPETPCILNFVKNVGAVTEIQIIYIQAYINIYIQELIV